MVAEKIQMTSYALQRDGESEDWVPGAGAGSIGREPSDYCSREGALALKAKIEAYWAERGHNVMIALHNVGFHPAIRAARFDVRSDMVNGMPRATGKKAAQQDVFVENFDSDDGDLAFE